MEPTPTYIECANTCTVTIQHQLDWQQAIALPLTSEQAEDYMALWGLILVAAVAVLCAKAIYNRFRIDHER